MKKIITGILFLMLASGGTLAQSSNQHRAWGYVFAGAGGETGSGSTGLFTVGVGGEGLVYKGLGLGAEVGYLAPFRGASNGLGILSTDVSYHFAQGSKKLVPFVTGGYSLGFRGGATASGGNFGGGVQYWMKDHLGLRLEFRDHVFSSDSPHQYQFRVGLSFR
jgi:hypothetical protein